MKNISKTFILIGIIIVLIPLAGKKILEYRQSYFNRVLSEQMESMGIADEDFIFTSPQEDFINLQEAFFEPELIDGNNESISEYLENTDISEQETTTQVKESTILTEETVQTEETTQKAQTEETTQVIEDPDEKIIETYKINTIIGRILIDKINVDVYILEGVEEEQLKKGVGHFPGTGAIGEDGNCCIAGHRSYTFGKFFNRLNEIKIGDKIFIKTNEQEFIYDVFEIKVVKPEDTYVLEPFDNKKALTLITCEPIYVATHRLIIHAELIQ